jgi:hypothetical protein
MSISTYAELQTAVASYLARTDLTSEITDFIRLAEIRLRRDFRIRQMLTSTTLTCVSGTATVTIPSDFLEVKDFVVTGNPVRPLNYESPSLFSRNSRSMDAGKPLDYTVLATTFKLAPIPDSNYTLTLVYSAAPAFLSVSNTSNEFLVTCPDLLLYGALLEAEPFLMNDNRLGTWAGLYDRAKLALTSSDERGQYSGVPLAMRNANI